MAPVCIDGRGYLVGVGPLCPPCGSWGVDLGHQAWWLVTLPGKRLIRPADLLKSCYFRLYSEHQFIVFCHSISSLALDTEETTQANVQRGILAGGDRLRLN